MGKSVAILVILGVVAVGYSDRDRSDVPAATSTSAAESSSSAISVVPPTELPTTTSSDPPPTTTATTAAPELPPIAGASSAGDEYFDGLGNGGYDALHYDIDFAIDPAIDEMEAVMTMRALATQTLSSPSAGESKKAKTYRLHRNWPTPSMAP